MKFLRQTLDKLHKPFAKGGKFERLYPLYEAMDTFLYTPGSVTKSPAHVRDSIDLKRYMVMVVLALGPCIYMAMWNTGFQANNTIHNRRLAELLQTGDDSRVIATSEELSAAMQASIGQSLAEAAPAVIARVRATQYAMSPAGKAELAAQAAKDTNPAVARQNLIATKASEMENGISEAVEKTLAGKNPGSIPLPAIGTSSDWRIGLMQSLGFNFNPESLVCNLLHGALYFLPVYIVCMTVGGLWEVLFAIVRGHDVNEGFLVTGMLFPLTLPPTIPLWQVAAGISFGVVIGKEVFGGTGRNFLNPALTARAFVYFAYPAYISGERIWTAVGVDGFSGATSLTIMATGSADAGLSALNVSWWQSFLGTIQGSMGETSVLACLIGAAILIAAGVGSWRIMLGMLVGAFATSLLFWAIGSDSNLMYALPPWWHLVIGGFAFGAIFMATDPVSASMTNTGRWVYGAFAGAITIIIRVINPAFPEGVMLAILLANVFAPLIDYCVLQANIKRRLARNAA